MRRLIPWLWNWLLLAVLFLWELARSVWDVAKTVINPQRVTDSAIVGIPLTVRSDLGIVLLANLITLTPGTVSIHLRADRKVLYIHVMNYDPGVVEGIKGGFERRVLKVAR